MMGDNSKIEWTDATWNPVTGCTKVSRGCRFCYAERLAGRMWATQYPPNADGSPRTFANVRLHDDRLDLPLRWRRPRRIFVNSVSDLFHSSVPDGFIAHVFAVMARAKKHTFQVLTKRPARMRAFLSGVANAKQLGWWTHNGQPPHAYGGDGIIMGWGQWPLPNVWLGVSVEDQQAADERIPLLLETPAAVRFLSCEPLLGPVGLRERWLTPICAEPGHDAPYGCEDDEHPITCINQVIAGGESGPKARPMHPTWTRSLRDQCLEASVPFFFKQWGEWAPCDPARLYHEPRIDFSDGAAMLRAGKRAAGRLLDGREWDEFPQAVAT